MSTPHLSCRKLTKDYSGGPRTVAALKGVELTIQRGEFVALHGPSGSGKTTLLNIIGGLDTPSSGEVVVGGRSLTELDDAELSAYRNQAVGFVFQSYQLLPHLGAAENVAVPLLISGVRLADAVERATELLDELGLADKAPFRPARLSGGQQQRVALARALVSDPELLLGDEVTGNLDSTTGAAILELIRRHARRRGLTVLLVSHDPAVAAAADRRLELVDGRLVAEA